MINFNWFIRLIGLTVDSSFGIRGLAVVGGFPIFCSVAVLVCSVVAFGITTALSGFTADFLLFLFSPRFVAAKMDFETHEIQCL